MSALTIIHRYNFISIDVVEKMLGRPVNGEAWSIKMEHGALVIDIMIGPVQEPPPAPEAQKVEEKPAEEPAKLKGGDLARRAGILCAERAFQTFLECRTEEEATELIRTKCAVESRAELDHNKDAGIRWRDIEAEYKVWLRG